MARVITFSREYPSYHPRAGEPTFFVEKLVEGFTQLGFLLPYKKSFPLNFLKSLSMEKFDPKWHTVRGGHRFKVGDKFSPRVWSGPPYRSKQLIIGPEVEIKKTWDFRIDATDGNYWIGNDCLSYDQVKQVASNDGLLVDDFECWFEKRFEGQIICWNEKLEY